MKKAFYDVVREAKAEWSTLQSGEKPLIMVGTATCGRSAGSLAVLEAFKQETAEHGLECNIVEVGCIGLCYAEPIVCIAKPGRPGICYGDVTPKRAKKLVESYLLDDDPVAEFALGTYGEGSVRDIEPLFETDVSNSRCGGRWLTAASSTPPI